MIKKESFLRVLLIVLTLCAVMQEPASAMNPRQEEQISQEDARACKAQILAQQAEIAARSSRKASLEFDLGVLTRENDSLLGANSTLSGEIQKIERTINKFFKQFFCSNPACLKRALAIIKAVICKLYQKHHSTVSVISNYYLPLSSDINFSEQQCDSNFEFCKRYTSLLAYKVFLEERVSQIEAAAKATEERDGYAYGLHIAEEDEEDGYELCVDENCNTKHLNELLTAHDITLLPDDKPESRMPILSPRAIHKLLCEKEEEEEEESEGEDKLDS